MPRIVVLGTGTGVGKTYVTAALARALGNADPGVAVLAMKPVETGIAGRRTGPVPPGSDAAKLERASRGPMPRPHPLYSFREPVSPHLAARQDAARISPPAILRWIKSATTHGTTLHGVPWIVIETAGGALSPLTARFNNADLARKLDPAIWILVASDSLGVFHDIRATLLGLEATARAPDHLVLSQARPPDAATGRNVSEFRRLGLPRPIAVLGRRVDPIAALSPLVRAVLGRKAAEHPGGR